MSTRKGTPIDNLVDTEPSEMELKRWYFIRKTKSGGNWRERKAPCGGYNCAGMVWASRRTSICEETEYRKILAEDGYRELQSSESPEIGDVVIYSGAKCGIVHIGTLANFNRLDVSGSNLPIVLSKWKSIASEDFHSPDDVGTMFDYDTVTYTYWTDRPLNK